MRSLLAGRMALRMFARIVMHSDVGQSCLPQKPLNQYLIRSECQPAHNTWRIWRKM